MKAISDLLTRVYINSIIRLLKVYQTDRGIRGRVSKAMLVAMVQLDLKMPWHSYESDVGKRPSLH